jgi:hypothetical protein
MFGTIESGGGGSLPAAAQAGQNAWAETLNKGLQIASQVFAIKNQQQLARANIDRARQGLPPIELSDIPGAIPTVRVEGDVGAQTSRLTQYAIFGALGLGALYLLTRKRGR